MIILIRETIVTSMLQTNFKTEETIWKLPQTMTEFYVDAIIDNNV